MQSNPKEKKYILFCKSIYDMRFLKNFSLWQKFRVLHQHLMYMWEFLKKISNNSGYILLVKIKNMVI